MTPRPIVLALIAALAIAGPAAAEAPAQTPTTFRHAIVVAAEPDAAEAGLKVLRAGGGAIDAAVAVQAVLGLEEPQSSGVGGGAFMLYHDARTGRIDRLHRARDGARRRRRRSLRRR